MINKKIINLTKVFFKDYSKKFDILNNKNKINKKSSIVWIGAIFIFCLTYISVKSISYLGRLQIPELFLKIYLPIVSILMLLQLIMIVCNLFYFSKDLEYVLPLPLKPKEILISKFLAIICIMYITEIIFLTIPLFMYGILIAGTFRFFLYSIFIMIVLPIFYTSIISLIELLMVNILKNIKNKNVVQIMVVSFLTACFMIILYGILSQKFINLKDNISIQVLNDKFEEINKDFIIIDPIVKLLINKNSIINILKIIFINVICFSIFYLIGKRVYNPKILINEIKNEIKNNKKNKYKKINKEKSYLKNEFKKLFKNTTYFLQYIFNYIIMVIVILFFIDAIIPLFLQQLQENNFDTGMYIDQIKCQIVCIVLIIIQIIITFNNLSITAISRDGKEAKFMKYIPISLYKLFIIKSIPQILLNSIVTIFVLIVISTNIPKVSMLYYAIVFLLSIIINIIYSFTMLIVDLKQPNLNWTNIESVNKNSNKMYQYIMSLIMILVLSYFSNTAEKMSFSTSIILISIFFIIVLILLNKYIKNNINKIFNKVY